MRLEGNARDPTSVSIFFEVLFSTSEVGRKPPRSRTRRERTELLETRNRSPADATDKRPTKHGRQEEEIRDTFLGKFIRHCTLSSAALPMTAIKTVIKGTSETPEKNSPQSNCAYASSLLRVNSTITRQCWVNYGRNAKMEKGRGTGMMYRLTREEIKMRSRSGQVQGNTHQNFKVATIAANFYSALLGEKFGHRYQNDLN